MLIELSTKTRQLDYYVRINKEAKADIEWWHCFLSEWNSTAMMWPGPRHPADIVVTSDATGTWGCGAYCGKEWFMAPWTAMYIHHHITVKELAPIVVSAIVWGSSWRGKTVLSRCDNAAVVAIINTQGPQKTRQRSTYCDLAYLCATKEFRIYATHISGVRNTLADALSSK